MRSAWGDSCNDCAKPFYSCGSEYPSFVTLRHLHRQSQGKKQCFSYFFVGFMVFPSVFAHFCRIFRFQWLPHREFCPKDCCAQHPTSAQKAPFSVAPASPRWVYSAHPPPVPPAGSAAPAPPQSPPSAPPWRVARCSVPTAGTGSNPLPDARRESPSAAASVHCPRIRHKPSELPPSAEPCETPCGAPAANGEWRPVDLFPASRPRRR